MKQNIPLFELNYGQAEEDAVLEVLRSKWISTGPKAAALEEQFAAHIGAKHAIAMTNCTAALHLALLGLDIGPGDEVIVPSLTFVATVNSIRYTGATPVFADIVGNHDFSIDPADIAKKITQRTKAIMVMHYAGFACDMAQIGKLAERHGLAIVEDCAHSPDAEFAGRKLGSFGAVSCFSFFSNKNITCAEGGLLVTSDTRLYERAKRMRAHGMTTLSYERAKGHATSYDVIELGYNYRLDDIRAALVLAQMKRLTADIARREELRATYLKRLSRQAGVVVPYAQHKHRASNYIMPIVLTDSTAEKRDRVRADLAEMGVGTSVHYPAAHHFDIYRSASTSLPRTEYAAHNEITLPLFFSMTEQQVDYVCTSLATALGKRA